MMTTTLFIDFGEGIDRHILGTVAELRRDLIGPDIAFTPYTDDTVLEIVPLRNVVQQLAIDFNDDGRGGDINDYTALRNATVALVQRQFEPFDIRVEVAAASTGPQIRGIMGRNAGDGTGQFDAYVLATGIYSGVQPTGIQQGWLGIASAVDLIQNLSNVTDEVVLVDGEFMLSTSRTQGWNYAVAMAHVISHEALHSLGLRHTNSGAILGGQLGTDQDILTQSELITEGGGSFLNVENVSFNTRYPLMMGDGNVNPAVLLNSFDKLANDPDIGLRPGGPRFVTGTGAFDRITITRLDFDTASVTVEPFRDNTFSGGSRITIGTGGTYSYILEGISQGIVVEGGRGEDLIIVDTLLSVPVTIRGGQGFDQLRLTGHPAVNAVYIPDQVYRFIPGNESYSTPFLDDRRQFVSYGGTVIAGQTNIRFDEFDDAGLVHFENFASAQFSGTPGFDSLRINSGSVGGSNEIGGTISGVSFPNMSYSNVRSVVIDTGAEAVTDAVDINVLNATGMAMLTVSTGAGHDFVTIRTPSLQLPTPLGRVNLNFGAGSDTLTAVADVNWTLSDTTLASSLGGVINLQGLLGETVGLVGGAGNNIFNVSGWNGRANLNGGLGTDSVNITRNANFAFGQNFVNVLGGGGSFTLGQMERLNLVGGLGQNTFIDYGWNGRGTIDGGIGPGDLGDMIATFRDSHVQLADNFYIAGGNVFFGSMGLTNIELASLTGGAGANQFDVSLRTRPAFINGAGGFDTIVHNKDVNYTLTNNQLTISGATSNFFSLANIDYAHLTGGGSANTFTISQWAGGGALLGGGGDDVFNIATGNLDAVAGFWIINAGFGNDQIVLNDSLHGLASNYLISPNNVTIAPGNFRRFGGLFFDGAAENLRLNASQAANRIDVTPSLHTTFTVDGNAPSPPFGDALVIHEAFTGPHTGPFNGPGVGQRRVGFNAGHRDVIFEEIEQLVFGP